MSNSEPYYPEQYAAAQIIKYGSPVMVGLGVAVAAGFTEHTAGLSQKMNESHELNFEIYNLQSQNDNLRAAEHLLDKSGATVNGLDSVVSTNQQQITELRAQKHQAGSELVATLEFGALPVALGITVAAIGLKRVIRRNRVQK